MRSCLLNLQLVLMLLGIHYSGYPSGTASSGGMIAMSIGSFNFAGETCTCLGVSVDTRTELKFELRWQDVHKTSFNTL